MPAELQACVERANLDPAVHVLLLSGNGEGFCGGYDLEEFLAGVGPAGGAESQGSPLDSAVIAANHDPARPWDPVVDFQMMSRCVRGVAIGRRRRQVARRPPQRGLEHAGRGHG